MSKYDVWSVLDVLGYLENRIDKLENVLEAYAMSGIDELDCKGDFYALCELRMLRNEILDHMEKEGGEE